MSNIKQRFSELARAEHITLAQLQERIGVSNAYVANISKGIGRNKALSIQRAFPNLNMDWLEYGTGNMYVDKIVTKAANHVTLITKKSTERIEKGIETVDKLSNIVSPIDNAEIAYTVYGESMSPEFPNGSILYLKKSQGNYITYGATYLIETDDGCILRKLMPNDETSYICVSSNKESFPDFILKKECIYNIYNVLACLSIK